ncbi:etoposide-induced 2.4 family protein [Lyngbya aestuarii BL J]|uniref:Etoposide-induced 2.4 family protein n=2 Tax=Lyngbya aestuarii BL J TaxID=1348334 RepID=U7QDX2_9CYAN|nr:EI24 domain-containing protein [Lyngbya aestuarii]ERT05382.1 etoposide-induced 2.4 family protein [Lyngbya aestuarii BL J]
MNSQKSKQPPSLLHAPVGLISGFTYPFRALGLFIRTPKLWGYVIVPVVINIIVGILLYVGLLFPGLNGIEVLVSNLDNQIDTWVTNLPTWLRYLDVSAVILGWLLRVVLVTALLFVIGFLLLQFGGILGAPWYGQLSEKLEELRTGKPAVLPPNSFTSIFQDIGRAILFELKKLVLQLVFGLPLLLLNFLPVYGSILFTIGGVSLATTVVCLDFLDAPLERRRLKFREKLKMIRLALPASGSFALVCFGLITIPFLNLLAIPICVGSGTLFFCDRLWPYYFASQEQVTQTELPPV